MQIETPQDVSQPVWRGADAMMLCRTISSHELYHYEFAENCAQYELPVPGKTPFHSMPRSCQAPGHETLSDGKQNQMRWQAARYGVNLSPR